MPAEQTIGTLFTETAQRYPTRIALILGHLPVTYQDLLKRVEDWCIALHDHQFRAEDRVLLAVHEHLDFIACWFALWQQKCIPIPLETSSVSSELRHAVVESRCHWLITSLPGCEALPELVTITPSPLQPAWNIIKCNPQPIEHIAPDTALFFYTSGTLGAAKCVIFRHQHMLANIIDQIQAFHLSADDICLSPLHPLLPATLTTIIWPVLCSGGTAILQPAALPGQLLRTIREKKVTLFYAVPSIYALLTSSMKGHGYARWDSVRLCLSSSAYLDPAIFDGFYQQSGHPIRSMYCTSEAGSCTHNTSHDVECVRASVGQALPGVALSIADSAGNPCLAGTEGEIMVQGTHLASGYVCQPVLHQQVFGNDWIKTGDTGFLDAEGFLYLTGRLAHTLNISGHLVNPIQVEQILLRHPAIAEAQVSGWQHPTLGEMVGAQLVLHPDQPVPSKDELIQLCSLHLASYKVPRHLTIVPALVKGRYGKIKRLPQTHAHIQMPASDAATLE